LSTDLRGKLDNTSRSYGASSEIRKHTVPAKFLPPDTGKGATP